MEPTFFATPSDFRNWLENNYDTERELVVGLYKKTSGKANMSWPQLVDQVLCFGWIDGKSKSIDADSWCIRITPRKADSIWSAVNITKMEMLNDAGLLHPAGIAAFEKRKESKSRIYSHESEPKSLDPEYEKLFKSDKKAWDFFNAQPAGYRKAAVHLVMTAKQPKTQISRLENLIADSANGLRMKQLRRNAG